MWRRDRIGFGAGTLAFAAVACGGLVSCGGDGPTSFGGGGPQLAVPQPPDALRQPSKIANIVEQMTFLCRQRVARGGDFSLLSHRLVHVSPVGEIEVVVHARTTITAAQEAQLIALGGRIAARLDPPAMSHMPIAGMVHVWLPHDALDKAAQLPWVVAITPPEYPQPDIVSEGVTQLRADIAQSQGVNGAGVTVGVVSDGVSNIAASQGRSELPGNCPGTPCVNVLGAGSGDEGTAMLEIVNDMAPGANLLFQGTGSSVVTHVNALNNLVSNGANTIAEDIPFDSEPAFQQGFAAATAEAIASGNVSVHSSAGNLGGTHAARVAAVGTGGTPDGVTFSGTPSGCATTPSNVVAIAAGGDTTFDVVLGSNSSITLQWSEPRAIFPTAGQGGFTNLDLYVMDAGLTTCLAQSVGVQANGVGDTIEQIAISSPGTPAKIVVNVQGTSSAVAAPTLDLRMRNLSLIDSTTRAGSLNPDSNYIGLASSVAAINANSGNLEGFSAAGPVQLGSTTVCSGGAAGPCTGVAGGGVTTSATVAPTWSASDGVSVSGVGGFGSGTCPAANPGGQGQCLFFGTSASAPHSAGCDALVRSLLGSPSVTTVRNRMFSTAVDQGPPGPDNVFGAGLLDCFSALGPPVARCQDITIAADATCVGNITPAQVDNGSSDPDGDPITLSLNTTGPFSLGTTSVTLTVSDGKLSTTCTANVTVTDQTPPMITCPASQTLECTAGGAVATFASSATDNCSVPTQGCVPPSGTKFGLGTTVDTCTATDAANNSSSCNFDINVEDTLPPVVTTTGTPVVLAPPDHKYVTFSLEECITGIVDQCDGPLTVAEAAQIVNVTSDEPESTPGSGNTCNDIEIVGTTTVNLRSERDGRGDGRVYTIHASVTDHQGNSTPVTCLVEVPHDQSGRPVVDSGPAFCVGSGCGTIPGHDPSCTH
jgi:hypothetical protein